MTKKNVINTESMRFHHGIWLVIRCKWYAMRHDITSFDFSVSFVQIMKIQRHMVTFCFSYGISLNCKKTTGYNKKHYLTNVTF